MKNLKRMSILLILLLSIFISPTVMAAGFVPPPRTLTRVEDEGNILSDTEEENLREKLDEISERHNVDVIVVTNYSLSGKSAMEFADDYFDYNGYGLGRNYDGVLLLLSMEARDWWISTHGYGVTAFTDYGIEYIGDEIVGNLSDGNYYNAFVQFGDLADEFIEQAKTGEPFDVDNKKTNEITATALLGMSGLSVGAGGLAGKAYTSSLANTHKTKRKQTTAEGYYLGIANFANTYDRFLNSNVTRSPIPKKSSSSGGSSTHTSSSGRSHGGGGGKF